MALDLGGPIGIANDFTDLAGHTVYGNTTGNSTTTLKTGPGVLVSVVINDNTTGGRFSIYDNTAGNGTKLFGPIQIGTPAGGLLSSSGKQGPAIFPLMIPFTTGLTIVTSGSSSNDIGVFYA